MLGVLLKKQMTEKLSYFKRDKKRIDIVGALLTLVMTAFIMYVVVEVFGAFVAKYTEIRLNGVRDVRARQYEIMTFVYEFVFAVDVIGGVVAINRAIFESDDRMIIQTLPVKASDVLYSKIIFIYAKQVLSAFVILVPFVAVFASVTKQGAGYVILGLLAAFIIPVMSLSVSSVLAMPYYYVKKFFSSKYVCLLVIVTLVLFVLFYCYATVLDFLKTLMSTGEIKFFFSEKTMTTIISLTKNLVPANFIAAFTLKTDVWKNLGIIVAITVATGAIGILITSLLYNKAMKTRATAGAIMIFAKKSAARKLPPFLSLLKKEFNLVLFTPDYAVQYFTVAAIMPLMVYFCMGIGKNFLSSLVFVQSDFELAILLTVLFGALTNTFCATNVSRDGKSFYVEKTLPLSINEIMGAKIALSFAVAVISVGSASCKEIRVGGRRRIRVFRRRDDGVVADTVRHKKGSEQSAVFAGRRQRREGKQQQRVDNRRVGACVGDASWRNTPFRQRIVERQGQRYALVYLRFRERVRGGGVCRLAFILPYRNQSPL